MLHHGDCLDIMPTLEADSVALIYADPPFATGRNYVGTAGAFTDTWLSMDAYLDHMRARLVAMRRVLSPAGSIYLHCDDTACHRLRCLMDDVFGIAAYRNTVIWKRSVANFGKSTFSRIADHILVYASNNATFNPLYRKHTQKYLDAKFRFDDGDGRGKYRLNGLNDTRETGHFYEWRGFPSPPKGYVCSEKTMARLHDDNRLVYPFLPNGDLDTSKRIQQKLYLSDSKGRPVSNVWDDINVLNAVSRERTGYPTQKPLALLERIVAASSNPGDMVFDPFMGSGTTLVAAKRLGRRFAGCDVSADAVKVAEARLADATERLV